MKDLTALTVGVGIGGTNDETYYLAAVRSFS